MRSLYSHDALRRRFSGHPVFEVPFCDLTSPPGSQKGRPNFK